MTYFYKLYWLLVLLVCSYLYFSTGLEKYQIMCLISLAVMSIKYEEWYK